MYCVFQYTQRQIDQQMYIFPCCKNYGKCIFFFFFFRKIEFLVSIRNTVLTDACDVTRVYTIELASTNT